MKRLVNEFRDYARLPAAELVAVNNALVGDVLQLTTAILQVLRCRWWPRLDLRATHRGGRLQVIHNLLQNAQDAQENKENALVTLKTDYSDTTSHKFRLTVRDSSAGFPEYPQACLRAPVTTKVESTSL
jgi:nitrogen fixation/metabolism regulation signal transduction histidine kinase